LARSVANQHGIPLTVVGGYLGSGKTTRINAVLRQPRGLRIAVVVNDFGAVNVDADLLRASAGDLLELANGCVCCSLADGMAAVMRGLSELRPAPDRVLVEVSGVGDPAAVATWGTLPGFRKGGVVVCVDAETVESRASDRWVGDTVRRQLEGADVFVLTKSDLVAEERRDRTRSWLASLAPGVPVSDDPDALADVLIDPPRPGDPVALARGDHDPHRTWSFSSARPVDGDRLVAGLGSLPEGVVRAKGIVQTTAAPGRRTVVQRAGRRCDLHDDGAWRDGDRSTLVVVATADPGVEKSVAELAVLFEG
jgi:G3E family GTPase